MHVIVPEQRAIFEVQNRIRTATKLCSKGPIRRMCAYAGALLIVIFVSTYANIVAAGVAEEKSSRIDVRATTWSGTTAETGMDELTVCEGGDISLMGLSIDVSGLSEPCLRDIK